VVVVEVLVVEELVVKVLVVDMSWPVVVEVAVVDSKDADGSSITLLADKLLIVPENVFPAFFATDFIALSTAATSTFASEDAMLAAELGDCPGGKVISNTMSNVDCSRRDPWYGSARRRPRFDVKDTM